MLLASQTVADYPIMASFPSYAGSRDIPNSTCRYAPIVGAVDVDGPVALSSRLIPHCCI